MKTFLVGIALVVALLVNPAFAESKPRVCRPDICQPRKDIPKTIRPLISRKEGLISTSPRVLSRKFFVFSDPSAPVPQMSVPADRTISQACHVNQLGKLLCVDEVSYKKCPTTISMTVEVNGELATADCDLNCVPNVPDASTGTCECEPISCVVAS